MKTRGGNKATHLCPCGYLGDGTDRCNCPLTRLQQYRSRLSGPLLDRFDMHIEVPQISFDDLTELNPSGESRTLGACVEEARRIQLERAGMLNARLPDGVLWEHVDLDADTEKLLKRAVERWQLSTRSTVRVIKVARTVADLAGSEALGAEHLAEALQLRQLDRRAAP